MLQGRANIVNTDRERDRPHAVGSVHRNKAVLFVVAILGILAAGLYQFTYSNEVNSIQRVLEDKWVLQVVDNGKWVDAIPRPCGPKAIKYAKKHNGFVLVGYYCRTDLCRKHKFKCIHVMVSKVPVKPGTVIYENDPRIVFTTGDSTLPNPVLITNVFTAQGKPVMSPAYAGNQRTRKHPPKHSG